MTSSKRRVAVLVGTLGITVVILGVLLSFAFGRFGLPWDTTAVANLERSAWASRGIKPAYVSTIVAASGSYAATATNLGEGDNITSIYVRSGALGWHRVATYIRPAQPCQFAQSGVPDDHARTIMNLLKLRAVSAERPDAESCKRSF